jgi:hypothetical protein
MSKTNALNLIVEEPCYEVKYLIEEQNRNEPSNFILQGPYLMAEQSNRNKRIYKLHEMVSEVDRYLKEMVSAGRGLGELEHPQSPNINLERACHMVTGLKQNGNIFEGRSKVLNTPTGILVKTLMQDGVKVGVSSRALGKLTPQGDCNVVEEFRLIAIDVVADPSVPTAFVNGILESKQWILGESGKFEPIYNDFENSISTLPKKNKDAYLKEQMLTFINSLKKL